MEEVPLPEELPEVENCVEDVMVNVSYSIIIR